MSTLPLKNMILVAKTACLIDTREQCAIAWDRVEEVSAHQARIRTRAKPTRTVIFNKDKLDMIKKNTLKIRRAEKEIDEIYLESEGFFVSI